MSIKIGLVSLGCAKNQVDAEVMAGKLKKENYEITSDPSKAEVIIINTCGFIDDAKQEAIDTILEMAEYKKTGVCKAIVVTGCLSERYFDEIRSEMPEVDAALGIGQYKDILTVVSEVLKGKKVFNKEEDYSTDYLDEDRLLFEGTGSAYLKIAEGCDNRCHYCAIPYIRGPFRSRPMESIISEARRLSEAGVKELVVVAQDTTRYGKDIYGEPKLPELLTELEKIEGIEWIRVMYLYPDEITEKLTDVMSAGKKILHYIDLPIQHISTRLLKEMNRRGTGEDIRRIFKEFKTRMPDCMVRTSLIVGYPGETEEDFNLLKDFLSEIEFDRVGIFKYSMEDGTPAAEMPNQVESEIAENRRSLLMELQQEISLRKNRAKVGKTFRTLVEGVSEDGIFYRGRTYAHAPEVDGYVYFTSEEPLEPGDMVDVKMLIAEEYDMTGEAVFGEEGKDRN